MPAGTDSSREKMLRGQMEGRESLFVFEEGEQVFAVPPTSVVEVTGWSEPTPVPFAPAWVDGVLSVRGRIVPVLDLGKFFGIDSKVKKDRRRVLVIAEQGHEFAIWAQSIVGLTDVDPGQLEKPLGNIPDLLRECSHAQFEREERLVYWMDVARLLEQTRKRVGKN